MNRIKKSWEKTKTNKKQTNKQKNKNKIKKEDSTLSPQKIQAVTAYKLPLSDERDKLFQIYVNKHGISSKFITCSEGVFSVRTRRHVVLLKTIGEKTRRPKQRKSLYDCRLNARKPQCRISKAFHLKLLSFYHLIQASSNTSKKKSLKVFPVMSLYFV